MSKNNIFLTNIYCYLLLELIIEYFYCKLFLSSAAFSYIVGTKHSIMLILLEIIIFIISILSTYIFTV